MLIAFVTSDLVFPSRLTAVSARIGARMETVASGPALLSKVKAAESGQTVVLFDLSTPEIDAVETIAALKALSPPPRAIIAFGPHVHEAKLAAAQAAGCDLVLSRGQFGARASAILEQYAAHSSD